MGRPTKYSPELADIICECLIEGLSLRRICEEDAFPTRSTVLRWLDLHPDFATKYARARLMQADLMDDLILEAAANVTPETAQAVRVQIGAYQWRAAKLKPKVYGDLLKLGDPEGEKIVFASRSPEQRAQALALMMAKRGGKRDDRRPH